MPARWAVRTAAATEPAGETKSRFPHQKIDKHRLVDFFIHCESYGISSRSGVYLITEGVYHQSQTAFYFRNDDIQRAPIDDMFKLFWKKGKIYFLFPLDIFAFLWYNRDKDGAEIAGYGFHHAVFYCQGMKMEGSNNGAWICIFLGEHFARRRTSYGRLLGATCQRSE